MFIIVNDYIARWGCPHTMLSDQGLEFANKVTRGVYNTLGTVKKFTSSYHPQTNGMNGGKAQSYVVSDVVILGR